LWDPPSHGRPRVASSSTYPARLPGVDSLPGRAGSRWRSGGDPTEHDGERPIPKLVTPDFQREAEVPVAIGKRVCSAFQDIAVDLTLLRAKALSDEPAAPGGWWLP
jgi:hypothetical protein